MIPAFTGQMSNSDRALWVIGGVAVLSVGAFLTGWIGLGLSILLLIWTIVGATGVIPGPIALLIPKESRNLTNPAGVLAGILILACGIFGARRVYHADEAEKQAELVKSINAEKERVAEEEQRIAEEARLAQEAAALAVREAELRANVAQAAVQYAEGLTALESLIQANKWPEGIVKWKELNKFVGEYQQMDPVPVEIANLIPRHAAVTPQIQDAEKVLSAMAALEGSIQNADAIKSLDGASQEQAQAALHRALNELIVLERLARHPAAPSAKYVAKTRKTIEKKLVKTDRIVAKYQEEKLAREMYVALCGEKPRCGGGWDGECVGAESAFRQVANDPSDVDVENCSAPILTTDNCWQSTCTVLARNGFGAMMRQRYVFSFSKLGIEINGPV